MNFDKQKYIKEPLGLKLEGFFESIKINKKEVNSNMEQKLNYLKKYAKDICLIPANEVDNIKEGLIPSSWRDIFKSEIAESRKNALLDVWRKYVGNELRNTISYLNEYLEDVEIIKSGNLYSILFRVRGSKGNILYYEGRNPLDDFENEDLSSCWDKFPDSLKRFYENVHNGFYYYASESMGLVPISSVTYLGNDDLEWGILEELKEPLQINLNTSFGFFTNGMGLYVVIDFTNCENDNAAFWSAKRQPKYNVNFWSYVDEWTVIGFQS